MYTGIIHIAPKPGAKPICGKRNALLSAPVAQHQLDAERTCKRCAAKWSKWQSAKANKVAVTYD